MRSGQGDLLRLEGKEEERSDLEQPQGRWTTNRPPIGCLSDVFVCVCAGGKGGLYDNGLCVGCIMMDCVCGQCNDGVSGL